MAKKSSSPKTTNHQSKPSKSKATKKPTTASLEPNLSSPNVPAVFKDNRQRRPPIPNVHPSKQKQLLVRRILSNPDMLEQMEEYIATGGSISTVEAILKLPPGSITRLLAKGKIQKEGPYRKFYILFRSWAGEAKLTAESSLNKRSPEKWLDRSTTAKMIESNEDAALAAESSKQSNLLQKLGAEKLLQAMSILQEQGISIDEALAKGSITVDQSAKDDDDA